MPVYLNQDSKHEPEKKNTLQWIGIFLKYVIIHDSFILLLVLSFVFLKNHELFAMLISPVLSLHPIMTFDIFLSLWVCYFGKTVTRVVSCAFIRRYIILF